MDRRYEISVDGHLPPSWSAMFGGMAVTCQPDGSTLIAGTLPDQAALFGVLSSLHDFGLTLLSVQSFPQEARKTP
jgi:hypothetical protein